MPRPLDALIAQTPLRHGEELRVRLDAFRGQQYTSARRWFDSDGVLKPGKGLSVRVDLLPWLIASLQEAERACLAEGLLEAEDYTEHSLPVPPELRGAA